MLTLKEGLILIFFNFVFILLADFAGVKDWDPTFRFSGVAVALLGAERVWPREIKFKILRRELNMSIINSKCKIENLFSQF